MPDFTWQFALGLVAAGFLLSIGWQLAVAVYTFIVGVLSRGRP